MNRLTDHIIYLGNRELGSISNLKLNKVLCLSCYDYLQESTFPCDIKLEGFELAPYGLMNIKEYRRYKIFGRSSINSMGVYYDDLGFLDKYICKYLYLSIGEIVEMAQGFEEWSQNIDRICNNGSISINIANLKKVVAHKKTN